MIDMTKPYWFEDVPFEREHQERIGNVLDIKQYFLRMHKVLKRPDFKFKGETYTTAKILEEEKPENMHKKTPAHKGKILPFDLKKREIINLAKGGLDSTEIARRLNCGKGEIELISKLIQ